MILKILNGHDRKSYEEDKRIITENIASDAVFILMDENQQLCDYIEFMHDDLELSNKILHKLRICNNIDFEHNVCVMKNELERFHPSDMKALLSRIEKGDTIIIKNNSRALLADILQRMIYIQYPITEIKLLLEKERRDAKKAERFMKNIDLLEQAIGNSSRRFNETVEKIVSGSDDPDLKKYVQEAQTFYDEIKKNIQKAKETELKVAIAASKKTGKSVIANSMIGTEIAPTSLERATPNTCVYKKSFDDNYHLRYGDTEETFSTKKEIAKHIKNMFKEAEKSESLTLPDMEIMYKSNKNNFETYTIYDTPGPDLAGQDGHKESAYNAISNCDVAVFAIDYSKYLIDSEEEYLKKVKDEFEKKDKFYSLVFVINKLDLALKDKEAKSRVRSIDFIRNKLIKIDRNYRECVIFATSAQDYFYTLELEEAATTDNRLKKLMSTDCDLSKDIDDISCDDNEVLDMVLSNVATEAGNIKRQLGYPKMNIEAFREYSGMPQMMSYISYIAKSKAREEIVNSIAHSIALQLSVITTLIGRISNIDALATKQQEVIDKISEIIGVYADKINKILELELTKGDYDRLSKNDIIKTVMGERMKPPVSYSVIIDKIEALAKKPPQKDLFYSDLWQTYKTKTINKLHTLQGKTVKADEIALNDDECKKFIQPTCDNEIKTRFDDSNNDIKQLSETLNKILEYRYKLLHEATQECKADLQKNDCDLILPEIPQFAPCIATNPMRNKRFEAHININMSDLGKKRFWRSLFKAEDKKEYKIPPMKTERLSKLENHRSEFNRELEKSKLYDEMTEAINSLGNSFHKVYSDNKSAFKAANTCCSNNIAEFQKQIDDRDLYERDREKYLRQKSLIEKIDEASKEFIDIWNKDIIDDKINA